MIMMLHFPGLAVKSHIDVGAGVVDSDYRGPVKVSFLVWHYLVIT